MTLRSYLRGAGVELWQEILVGGEDQFEQGLHVDAREGGAPPAAVEVVADQPEDGESRLRQADRRLRGFGEPAAQHRLEIETDVIVMLTQILAYLQTWNSDSDLPISPFAFVCLLRSVTAESADFRQQSQRNRQSGVGISSLFINWE